MALRHQFAGHHIALIVDGDDAKTAFLKSAEGGTPKAAAVEEPSAGYHLRGKHAAVRELEPLSFELGMAGSRWALDLIDKIVAKPTEGHAPFSGEILHADSDYKIQYTYEFSDARVSEFTLPKLDAKSKEFAYLKLKAQPELVSMNIADGGALPQRNVSKQRSWQTNSFRLMLSVDGEVWCSSIEALTVKIGAKAYQMGGLQNPQYTATGKLEMPTFSFVVPLMYAKKVLAWFQKSIHKEGGHVDGGRFEQDAIIEYLDQAKSEVLYTITLTRIGPLTYSMVKGGDDAVPAMKFDCYVTGMLLEASGAGII